MNAERLLAHYEQIADAPNAIARLRRFILDLAVRGKLVPQDAKEEPASELLKRIAKEKARLVKAGEIKEAKPTPLLKGTNIPVPIGWKVVPLEEAINSHLGGGTPSKNNHSYWDGDIRWASVKDVGKQKYLDETIDRITAKGLSNSSSNLVPEGNLIVVTRMGLGQLSINRVPVAINQDLRALFLSHFINIDYVYNFLLTYGMEGTGLTVKGIKIEELLGIPFPLPPLPEQHRIVAKVDELMRLCDQLEASQVGCEVTRDKLAAASLARLNAPDPNTFQIEARFALDALPALTYRPDQIKALRQTILSLAVRGKLVPQDVNDEPASELLKRIEKEREAKGRAAKVRAKRPIKNANGESLSFLPQGWAEQTIGNLVDPTATISYGVLVPGPDVDDGVPFVRVQDLCLSGHLPRPNKSIAPEIEAPYARTRLKGGEILLCVVGSIGKLGVAPASWAGANIARAVVRIAPVEAISSEFLLVAMQSDLIQNYFSEATRTLAQPTLNVGLVEVLPIPLPPFSEQGRIVAKVDELMALCDQLQASLSATTATRSRLLDALLAEALAPIDAQELLAAE